MLNNVAGVAIGKVMPSIQSLPAYEVKVGTSTDGPRRIGFIFLENITLSLRSRSDEKISLH